MQRLAIFVFRLILLVLFAVAPLPIFAACSPPADYRDCPSSSFGSNGVSLMDSQYNPIETDFTKLRELANQSDPAAANQRIQATIILTDGTISDQQKTMQIFRNAEKYGIDMTIRTWGNDVETPVATKMGADLAASVAQYKRETGNDIRIELGNEPNLETNGSNYARAFAAFTRSCTGCSLYLPSLGGVDLGDKQAFVQAFATNSEAVRQAQKVSGIIFNSYADDPREAVSDWVKTVNFWEGIGVNTANMRFFLTETGPSIPEPDRPGVDQFLADIAKEFQKIKSNPNDPFYKYFQKLDGLTYFIWDKNQRVYLYYVDSKGVVRKSISQPSANIPGEIIVPQAEYGKTSPPIAKYRTFAEESEEACIQEDIAGVDVGPFMFRRHDGKTSQQLRSDAGLALPRSVAGRYCGQTKSEPIMLQEVAPYRLNEEPKCKVVKWMGELQFNYNAPQQEWAFPFAQEVGDQWAGRWDAEHEKETVMEAKEKLAAMSDSQCTGRSVADQNGQRVNACFAARREIEQKTGVLKKLLPIDVQDKLKCDFIRYAQRKGGRSAYGTFRVNGNSFAGIPCPPTVDDPTLSTSSPQYAAWSKRWAKTWSMLGLYPNERTNGQLRFFVCDDKEYYVSNGYPEMLRLAMSANTLFQTTTSQPQQDVFYRSGYEQMRDILRYLTGSAKGPLPKPPQAPTPPAGPTPPPIASPFEQIPIANKPFPHKAEDEVQLNIKKRGWEKVEKPKSLVCIGYPGDEPPDVLAPQVGAIIGMPPGSNPADYFTNTYRVLDPGGYGGYGKYASRWEVSLLGLKTTPGQNIYPANGVREIGGGNNWLVLYAAKDYITLFNGNTDQFDNPLENNAVLPGYTVHIDGVAVDPNLVALYENLNARGRGTLPTLRADQVIGKAIGDEVRVSVRDSDDFMDVRSKLDFWSANFDYAACGGANPDKVRSSLKDVIAGLLPKVKKVFAQTIERGQRLLAQAQPCAPADRSPLSVSVEVVNPDPNNFVYSLSVSRTGYAPPGILGDIYINPPKNYEEANPGKTGPHVQSMTGNELKFYSYYDGASGFMPPVKSVEQLRQYRWEITGKSLPEGSRVCEPIIAAFEGATGQPEGPRLGGSCDPTVACCETATCTFGCNICKRAQVSPSDTDFTKGASHLLLGVNWGKTLSDGAVSPDPVKLIWKIPDWTPGTRPLPPDCRIVVNKNDPLVPSCSGPSDDLMCGGASLGAACSESEGKCGEIVCVKVHDRVVDVYNKVPFADVLWKQVAGIGGQIPGFIYSMKPQAITGQSLPQPSGCNGDPNVVFDAKGNVVPNPGASYIYYGFDQGFGQGAERARAEYNNFGKGEVTVTMVKPVSGEKSKILFYRMGGICNVNRWLSYKALAPIGLGQGAAAPSGPGVPAPAAIAQAVAGLIPSLAGQQATMTTLPNGNVSLAYEAAQINVIYSPLTGAVVSQKELVPVALRNGTPNTSLFQAFEQDLSAKATELSVSERGDARRKDYQQSVIIDPRQTKPAKAGELANLLRLPLAKMPTDEATPSADFLIIVGGPTIAIRNGTSSNTAPDNYEKELRSKLANLTITEKKDAASKNYQSSVIIDITGKNTYQLGVLKSILGLADAKLTTNEPAPAGADFLIILGADKK